MTKRIAMWSGPRNLSTAMMYSFGARSDTEVIDEPFYAAYLQLTGLEHPMRDEVLAAQPTDPDKVIEDLFAPTDKPIQYQKHMTHHMVPGVSRDWMRDVTNVYLVRHPARVVASYAQKRENPTLDDLGFRQQAELYTQFPGPVLDSAAIRKDPEGSLKRLCAQLDIEWDPVMLSWPAGPHPSDGVWAKHWYGAVHASTGFSGSEGDVPKLTGVFQELADAALPFYHAMAEKQV